MGDRVRSSGRHQLPRGTPHVVSARGSCIFARFGVLTHRYRRIQTEGTARMSVTLEEVKSKIDSAIVDDPEQGVYRGRREAFTDPEIFELEMKYIFEGNW